METETTRGLHMLLAASHAGRNQEGLGGTCMVSMLASTYQIDELDTLPYLHRCQPSAHATASLHVVCNSHVTVGQLAMAQHLERKRCQEPRPSSHRHRAARLGCIMRAGRCSCCSIASSTPRPPVCMQKCSNARLPTSKLVHHTLPLHRTLFIVAASDTSPCHHV